MRLRWLEISNRGLMRGVTVLRSASAIGASVAWEDKLAGGL